MRPDPRLQDQPESTLGHRPADLHEPEHRAAPEEAAPDGERFARSRARREEAEESDVGGELREREDEHDRDTVEPLAPFLAPGEPGS